MRREKASGRRYRGKEVGSTMIYKNMTFQLLSCDPRACLATGAMGKPQTSKRAPTVKHENQPPPHLPLLSLVSPFLSNTSPVPRRCRFVQLRPGKRREDEVDQRYREEEAGSMMIYKKQNCNSIMRPACLLGDRRYGKTSDSKKSANREA